MQIKILHIFLMVFITSALSAQPLKDLNYQYGEVLVQLKADANINDFTLKVEKDGFHLKQTVSERFKIFLLTFNHFKTSNDKAINLLSAEKEVVNIQNNHFVALREADEVIPDDSYFGQQWALNNSGVGGGVEDADIDAPEAWEHSTGGVSANGDTLVLAIIDSGSDLNHDDVNFWKNEDEIPDNGIDDDNNGYIDDYNGWNAFNHKDDITLTNHGIHVTGIAAARGNNAFGICGVNWNMKVVPVIGSSTNEAIVVEALSYVYTLRETYELTNGEMGAFIVADNCSFGVDKGQPEDYPIWEAMYDSLGQLGVLSVGSTANHEWDIDEVGDVPCSFTTDYLIAVTNTTKQDELYGFAGWGDTTIDLGAPGTLIKSLFINNLTGNKSGTSMASPHVTGTVGLLFSAADTQFLADYKQNPADGAKVIKRHILKGVDALSSLQGMVVTGGRLNANNAVLNLINAPFPAWNEDSIYVEIAPDDTDEYSFVLSNTGNDTLYFELDFENNPAWVSAETSSGAIASGEQMNIKLIFNSNGLDTAYYSTLMNIKGDAFINKNIKVALNVRGDMSIRNSEFIKEISVYPNPTNDKLYFIPQESGVFKVSLFDLNGRRILEKQVFNPSRQDQIILDLKEIEAGVYFYLLESEEFISTGKIIRSTD